MRREKDNQPRPERWVGSGAGTNRWLAVVRGIDPAPDGAAIVENGQEIQTRLFEGWSPLLTPDFGGKTRKGWD
jgi:hypothetical protein